MDFIYELGEYALICIGVLILVAIVIAMLDRNPRSKQGDKHDGPDDIG